MRTELAALALTSGEKYILIAIMATLMVFVLYFEMRVMRSKSKEVRKVAIRKDEAENALIVTRSVVNAMRRQGRDTKAAESLLASAKQAKVRGDPDRCIDLCERARQELIKPPERKLKMPVTVENEEEARERLEEVAEGILTSSEEPEPDIEEAEPEAYKGTKLGADRDGNYMAAKFEISAAKKDIQRAADQGKETAEAQSCLAEAERAFVAGSYTRALSLAVRARKATSTEAAAETIPLKASEVTGEPSKAGPPPTGKAPRIAAMCNVCGEPLDPEDVFCAKCGARVPKERICRSCGTKPRPVDAFCRKCGSRLD
ncbi:MAG: zinc ribbon domain-containing protein [Thermoplasmata archaeon]